MIKYLSLLGVLFLVACQAKDKAVEQTPPPPEPVLEETSETAKEAETIVVEPPKPRFVIENILNLAPATLFNILGQPALLRKEKDAEVWLYRNQECVMHLYFYPNDNGDFRLEYVETLGVDIAAPNPTVSPNACLDSHVLEPEDGPKINPQPFSGDKDRDLQPDRLDN